MSASMVLNCHKLAARKPLQIVVVCIVTIICAGRLPSQTLHSFVLNGNPASTSGATWTYPSTTIRYALPHRSHVTLTVFTALGQKMAELVSGDIDAGYHEVKFNGSRLASGVYFYRLQAGEFVQTKSIVLIR